MWPEEAFGGVSDEQFWDDLASDKPLATTARTARPDGAPLPSPAAGPRRLPELGQQVTGGPAGPSGPRHGDRRPADRAEPQSFGATTQAFPASSSQTAHGTTQAFKISGGTQAQNTGPQPVRAATGPQPIVSPTQSHTQSQPLPVRIHPPAPPSHSLPPGQLNRPGTGPQPIPVAQSLPQPQPVAQQLPALPAAQPLPAAQYARPAQSHGRHSAGEDPLTSSAYSLRSSSSVDGRSYQASRRARELTRDQYEAAISQETQTFSVVDGDSAPSGGYQTSTPAYGYELPPAPARPGAPGIGNGRAPDAYRQNRDGYAGTGGYSHPYSQPAQGPAGAQTPPYGESYGYDRNDGGRPSGRGYDRDRGRPAVKGGRPADPARGDRMGSGPDRPGYGTAERPAYPPRADRPTHQNGYPGPYDSRGTDRRG